MSDHPETVESIGKVHETRNAIRRPISVPSSSKLEEPFKLPVLRLEGAAQAYGSAVATLPGGAASQAALARWDVARVELEELLNRSWRCFHCGELFTREQDAAEHFGGQLNALAGCQIRGSDGQLLGYIRDLEEQLERWTNECHPLQLALAQARSEHAIALQRAEEEGYARGCRDTGHLVAEKFVEAGGGR